MLLLQMIPGPRSGAPAVGIQAPGQNVVSGGNGDPGNYAMNTFAVFSGYLYVAGENDDGAEVWRTSNGSTWYQVGTNGLGDSDNIHIGSLVVFNNALYACTRNNEHRRSDL